MTRLLPWLAGAALVLAVLLGVGYCGEKRDNARWERDWDTSQAELAVVVHERDQARLATDTVILVVDSLRGALAKAPTVQLDTVAGETVFMPDTTRPDSVIVIPAPVATRLAFLESHVVAQQQAMADLTAGISRERVLTSGVERQLRVQIELLENKPRDNGWRVVYGAGYSGTLDVQARAFAHGPSAFVGVAKAVPFPRIFPRRS